MKWWSSRARWSGEGSKPSVHRRRDDEPAAHRGKIAPEYGQATVHVLDASRAVDVVSSLLSDQKREGFMATVRAEQADLREKHSARRERALLTHEAAKANRLKADWDTIALAAPWFVGRRIVEPALDELTPFIDWTFFFSAWELKGRFPAILDHPEYGAAARDLYGHAQALLQRITREKLLTARGVYGFWPANAIGDDSSSTRRRAETELVRFPMPRHRSDRGRPSEPVAGRLLAPLETGVPITWVRSPSRPASGATRWSGNSSAA
jgi:5-methyltetrahydrofolate--homocysteine methyltransferase